MHRLLRNLWFLRCLWSKELKQQHDFMPDGTTKGLSDRLWEFFGMILLFDVMKEGRLWRSQR